MDTWKGIFIERKDAPFTFDDGCIVQWFLQLCLPVLPQNPSQQELQRLYHKTTQNQIYMYNFILFFSFVVAWFQARPKPVDDESKGSEVGWVKQTRWKHQVLSIHYFCPLSWSDNHCKSRRRPQPRHPWHCRQRHPLVELGLQGKERQATVMSNEERFAMKSPEERVIDQWKTKERVGSTISKTHQKLMSRWEGTMEKKKKSTTTSREAMGFLSSLCFVLRHWFFSLPFFSLLHDLRCSH